jgi:hypothetical protein
VRRHNFQTTSSHRSILVAGTVEVSKRGISGKTEFAFLTGSSQPGFRLDEQGNNGTAQKSTTLLAASNDRAQRPKICQAVDPFPYVRGN